MKFQTPHGRPPAGPGSLCEVSSDPRKFDCYEWGTLCTTPMTVAGIKIKITLEDQTYRMTMMSRQVDRPRRYEGKENQTLQEQNVETMSFSNSYISKSTVDSIREFLHENRSAVPSDFTMDDCDGNIEAVLEAVLSSDEVENVAISDGRSLSNSSVILSVLGGKLANNHSITDLKLSIRAPRRMCAFSFLSFIGGLTGNQNLHSLTFDRCPISDGNANHLVRAIEEHPSLCELNLDHGCLSNCDAFAPYLGSPYCTLETLRITYQKPTANRPLRIGSLTEALKENKSLRTLSLAGNRFDDYDILALVSSLSRNNTLQTLDLGHCDLSDDIVEQILSCRPDTKGLNDYLPMSEIER